jgi:hypothetical protein
MNPTCGSERDLRELTKRPVLGSLSLLADARSMAAARQDQMRILGAVGLFLVVHAAWITWVSFQY